MIKLVNLTKKYGNLLAVNNLNLEIKKGEIFGFLGPNGAGKTTTIKMICGLVSITKGEVYIDGINLEKKPIEYKKKFAYIPDKPFIFEKLRGIEYLEFIANLYDVNKNKFKELFDKYVKLFEMENYLNDFIESYSHGMSQKLLIIDSLIHSPDVFILDEPMVGLDPRSIRLLKEEFKRLAENGTTIFMSTHSIDIAEDVCTTVGIIDKGQIIEIGSLKEIKEKNKSEKLEEIFFKLTEENE